MVKDMTARREHPIESFEMQGVVVGQRASMSNSNALPDAGLH